MKVLRCILSLVLLLTVNQFGSSQINANMPERTPEQEAIKQTEKLQQAVQLTPEQVTRAYEINLKYARERQISNKRSEAVERLKSKNDEINRILNKEQGEQLQSKRYQRSTFQVPATGGSGVPVSGAGYRSAAPSYRAPSTSERSVQQIRSSFNAPSESGSRTPSREINTSTQSPTSKRTPSSSEPSPTINRSQPGIYSAPRKSESTRSEPATTTSRQTPNVPTRTNSTSNSQRR